jgi:L-Ala-D/L-Glu epimerase
VNISDLELFLIELPASGGAIRSLVLRLATDTGLEGWGETRKSWWAGELPARRKGLLATLVGREVHDIESILALDACADRALACAIEMALWDLVARAARQPLANLLGGFYRQNVPLAVRLPNATPDTMAHWARAYSAQGIASQIISTTGALESDLKLVNTLAEACGERVQFRFDARGQYDLSGALQLCRELEPQSVQMVIDPLPRAARDRASSLRVRSRVSLGAYEGIERSGEIMQIAQSESARFVVVDPVQVGGILRARQCAAVADAAGLAATLRIEGTSGLGLAATLQLAAATPSFISGHECEYPKLHDDILGEPLWMIEGMLAVPSGVGLGVEIDRDKLDCYQVSG